MTNTHVRINLRIGEKCSDKVAVKGVGCKSFYIFLVVYSLEQVSATGFVAVTVGRVRVFYASDAAT